MENEDDLKIAIKIARLFNRQEKRLSLKGLKMLFQVYSSPVFAYAIALYPKDNIIRGLLTLLVVLERRFNLQEEAKVPKELLKFDPKLSSDVDSLFSSFTNNKAMRMRQEVFQILKRVQKLKILDRKQISPIIGFTSSHAQKADIGG